MFWISGVWDEGMKRRLVGFAGLLSIFALACAGAVAGGVPLFIRLIF